MSYWDLILNFYPIKKVDIILKKYSPEERAASPPSVVIDSYADEDGEISADEVSLWPDKLEPGIEYGLRRLIARELKFYRRVWLFNQKVNSKARFTENDKIIGNIDFSELFADLIQFKNDMNGQNKGLEQKLSSREIKKYIIDVTKDDVICDSHLIRSIMRRLDRDMDGYVSFQDYILAIQPLEADINFLRDTLKKLVCRVKLDQHTLFKKKMDKNFYEVDKRAKSSAKKHTEINRSFKVENNSKERKVPHKEYENIKDDSSTKNSGLTWSQLLKSGK